MMPTRDSKQKILLKERNLKATASAADPQGKEIAWEYWYFLKCSNEGIL